ncbi:alpha-glucosidase [Maritalea myrionectae]|uniref:Alpha-glucosidase n=1 Tax=Maritalea myrionectae TaxID=454601 RepID=A0A2R4MHJ1_9HYPH|nr:alpha-glucosidase family protein [Maritalea myrionectae]AVX05346.1 alpha-glucosidase [Maritalea myrionectae]
MSTFALQNSAKDKWQKQKDWWRGAVIYQIYPRSFQDANGDGIGDLRGITDRLDYVADLGVDAIWLSPFFTSPMKDFGYDVSNYRDVDPIFGTLADFDQLLEKAHSLGLKVMIDQVISHTSDLHDWFEQSRRDKTNEKADWYVWADAKPDGSPPNNWLSIFGGSAWTWDPRRCQYYLHNFLASQPDLNFHNAEVRKALLSEVRFWLDRGVDGFRLDTVNFYVHDASLRDNPALPKDQINSTIAPAVNPYNWQNHQFDKSQPENVDFLADLRAVLDEYDHITTVGEIGDAQRQLELMAEYTSGGNKLHMAYTFDFLGGEFKAPYFAERIKELENIVTDGWPCWAFSNHDVVRHVSRWATNERDHKALARLSAMLLLSLRGSVCLYQGEELALPEADIAYEDLVDPYGIEFWPNFKGRDGCRTPMVWQKNGPNAGFSIANKTWLPVPRAHKDLAVDQQGDESILRLYQDFLRFRRDHKALTTGAIEKVSATDQILSFERTADDERLLCLFNMSDEAAEIALDMNNIADSDWPHAAERTDAGLKLPPLGAYIGVIG